MGLGDLVSKGRAVRHLTKRAIEAFAALAARRQYVHQDDMTLACTGTSALGDVYPGGEVVTAVGVAIVAGGLAVDIRPTCPACGVLLDAALEGAGTTSGPSRPGSRRSLRGGGRACRRRS